MYTYTIKGAAKVRAVDDDGDNSTYITGDSSRGQQILQSLDGLDDDSLFSDYWEGRVGPEIISAHAATSDPRLIFEYDKETKQLMATTTYIFTRTLNETEIRALEQYTTGQWSDGIGEGFEQQELEDGYYVSSWSREQKVTVVSNAPELPIKGAIIPNVEF